MTPIPGGSICAVFDDILGWVGFISSGTLRPWSGFTAQVNVSLKKPVSVCSVLKLEGGVSEREGKRKIRVWARLFDPQGGIVHAEATGLFILKRDEQGEQQHAIDDSKNLNTDGSNSVSECTQTSALNNSSPSHS
uniref:Thioesterase domain-containing protein n=1 Tax=Corethron hystrix TaxID=216773 RepID=A0A7S1C0T2_9STRA|mmetsp:Transcript_6916/g.14926  ORF Transcript_6916/g.14926 Transcript_6916/m.14926 type:complete len:135 (+) Transcript_6916:708-1112(+)